MLSEFNLANKGRLIPSIVFILVVNTLQCAVELCKETPNMYLVYVG